MVSMCKMDKLCRWTLQYLLLCSLWTMANAVPGSPEHSSLGVYSKSITISGEDKGEILLFIVQVIVGELGKKLDKGYRCPTYCGVYHKHIYWEIQPIPVDTTKYLKKNLALYR